MDVNAALAGVDPETLALSGGLVGGLARELVRWRGLVLKGDAAVFAQPLFLAVGAIEVALGGGLATLAHSYMPMLMPALALLAAFLIGAGFEEIVKQAARFLPSGDVTMGRDGKLKPTLVDFLRS